MTITLDLMQYNRNIADNGTTNAVGDPIITLNGTLGDNEIWLEGAEVSCTTYSKLYEIYGDTYGTASEEGNFVLPDFRDRAIWGGEDFGYLSAGLPNIYGTFAFWGYSSSYPYGSRSGMVTGTTQGSGSGNRLGSGGTSYGTTYHMWYLNASTYNSIYGNSDTVQPPAIKVRVKTRYA